MLRLLSGHSNSNSLRDSMTKHELAAAFYRRGVSALEHCDHRTAAELFQRAVRLVPDNLMYANLAAKYSGKTAG